MSYPPGRSSRKLALPIDDAVTEPILLLLWAAAWALCAFGYLRGTAYGLRFLEDHALIDTAARDFHAELLFGPPGRNYQRFYAAHSPRFGKSTTLLMIAAHLMTSAVVFLLPVVLAQRIAG
jgi:hypothetical protein